ncbi:hypothetical protein FA10DRAFT_267243 [Acaromyces ingoldii]|uniref:Protein kinase domain-containing protein n=1 Tax=Acaromyces ingoldii TaxID=215250 RepID=A0A316YNG2_9BASI|nr:hypothetical protein FA10DRAFT_267243 [Acaromyces ingoldii]PWN90809.1 hypothetical protein FA10DRAFT_267243 [Acaromyces ingoldii]
MDYFKTAATALLSKGGPLPNYNIGEREAWFEGRTIWSLHEGTKRDDSSPCSILIFDAMVPSHNPRKSVLPLAKNALRKLRTTRHPDVVKLLDSAETPTAVYIVVEQVRPLGRALEEMKAKPEQRAEWVGWGLSKIADAVKFLNSDTGSTHGLVRLESIFLASSGEWRLAGFELLSSPKDESPVLYNQGSLVPDAARCAPPEVKQQGWGVLRDLPPHPMDSFGFALLVIEAYNGSLPPSISAVPPQGQVPAPIYALVRRMMVPNAKNRLPVANLLEAGQADGGFFTENRLVKVASGLDGFMLSREDERAEIMRQLKSSSDSFPPEFLHYKVLPTLVNALSLSSSPQNVGSPTLQASKILPLVLQLGAKLPDKEWSRSLSAPLLKAWTSADRGVRMTLLESLELYMDRLEAKRISDSVWPNLITGFGDSAPVIREATVKAILPLSEKLSERILNNDLLRQLARSQVDNEAGIRTNTTILLGRLAPKLNLQTRKTVLIPAFARSMKDPFVHARVAGIMSLMATGESYDGDDAAKQIIPAIAPCLVDKEKMVRDQAFMAMKMFMERVKDKVKTMPDTALPPEQQQQEAGSASSMAATASANGSSATPGSWAASALAGWTQSAFAKHIDTASLAATTMDGKQTPSAVSTPPVPAASPAPSSSTSAASEAPSWSKQGDLMDVNDDEADWSGFETAPPKKAASLGGARRKMGARAGGGGGGSSSSNNRTSRAQPSLSTRPIASSSSSSSLSMRASGDALSAMTRKSLAVADAGAADDAAWDEPPEEEEKAPPSASTGQPAVQRTESPASAFKKPVEAWGEEGGAGAVPARAEEDEPGTAVRTRTEAGTGASVNETAAWGAIDDAFEDDQDGKGKSSSTTASAAMTREERRAEMERKREERRQRMAQLKQSKAQKLASGLA